MPTFSFKVSLEEARAIRAKARAENANVSAFVRSRVLDAKVAPRRKRIIQKHPVSGLYYDAKPGPTVSQAEIDAALANFPAAGASQLIRLCQVA